MQIKYRFFFGGEQNPYEKEYEETYSRITEEREHIANDAEGEISEVFPKLQSWPNFVLVHSKFVFWKMEYDICKSGINKAEEILKLWEEAKLSGTIGKWLKELEEDENGKAMCYYMASLYNLFNPLDKSIDFRLYFTESPIKNIKEQESEFSLDPLEY